MNKAGLKIVVILGLAALAFFLVWQGHKAAQAEEVNIKNGQLAVTDFNQAILGSDSPTTLTETSVPELQLIKNANGDYQPENVYISKDTKADFPFNAIGARWQFNTPLKTSLQVEIAIYNGSVWGDWKKLEAAEDLVGRDDKTGGVTSQTSGVFFSNLIFQENGQQFKYRLTLKTTNPAATPSLDEITFYYLDSTSGPAYSEASGTGVEDLAAPTIISRTAWGCPDGESSPSWASQTASKSFQVYHHTVSPNGAEPYSTMRAIWHYQAITRGWGDIGYNYLIDQYGHVFKGRNGPDNVVGAHVYGYNTHSIGVALLGDYRTVTPSAKALSGLSTILAYSAYKNGINIKLYGHRQLDATICPGDKLYAQKASVALTATTRLQSYRNSVVKYNNQLYYREPTGDSYTVRLIPNNSILSAWGLNRYPVVDVTQATFESYTSADTLDYFAKDGAGRVYVASVGKKHYMSSTYYKSWGIDKDNLKNLSQLLAIAPSGIPAYNLIKCEDYWYYLSSGKRQLILRAVFKARGYDQSRLLPVGTDLRSRFPWGGYKNYRNGSIIIAEGEKTRWLVDDGQVRFCSYLAYKTFHLQSRPVYYQSKTFVYSFRNLGHVLYPNGRFLNFRGMVYRVNNGKKQYVRYADVLAAWQMTKEAATPISLSIITLYPRINDLTYPTGMLVKLEGGQVYFMYYGTRKLVSGSAMTSWGFNAADVRTVPAESFAAIPSSGSIALPEGSYLGDVSNKKLYLISGGKKRWMPDWNIFAARGYNFSKIKWFQHVYVDKYPSGANLFFRDGTLFKQREDTSIFYMTDAGKRRFVSLTVLKSWHYSTAVRSLSATVIAMIPTGSPWPPKKVTTLLGPYGTPVRLPAYSGKVCREQHLWLTANETASHHYSVSHTPADCQNGMAGGYGAFGSAASISRERYYVNMRWLYATWYEDSNGNTKVKNLDLVLKSWHRHKKLIVTNPANGKSVVASIEEAGPAIWTGRVSGLSPEAMKAIGASCNDNLTYYWSGLQSISLGPIN